MPPSHHADPHDPRHLVNRAGPGSVALETTLILHGVPRAQARALLLDLDAAVRAGGARPAFVGLFRGTPTVGLSDAELAELLAAGDIPKANTANLGALMHRRSHAATTIASTMELAAAAAIRVFATGGLGGIHPDYGRHLDISADLAALTRFPVAVVASGVKSILDVQSTREAIESLGIPVIGFGTDRFPAFYLRESPSGVDERFDDEDDLAAFVGAELARTRRAVVIANPIPKADQIDPPDLDRWLAEAGAKAAAQGITGRALTPFLLGALHEASGGRTLAANIALAKANAHLGARLAHRLAGRGSAP